jgi:TRAP-type C4-dicarboxylate transport system permease small subunit
MKLARWLERFLEIFVVFQMFLLAIVVIAAVIWRKLGASFSWYDEVAAIQLAWITYYGAALAALKRKHIGFDGVLLALPPRVRAVAVYLAEALTITFFALMTWAGIEVLTVLGGMTLVSLTWVPIWFTQSVIPIGGVLFIVASLLSFPGYYRAAMQGKSFEHLDVVEEH